MYGTLSYLLLWKCQDGKFQWQIELKVESDSSAISRGGGGGGDVVVHVFKTGNPFIMSIKLFSFFRVNLTQHIKQ